MNKTPNTIWCNIYVRFRKENYVNNTSQSSKTLTLTINILLAELEMIHYTYARCDSTTTGTVTLMWWPRDTGWMWMASYFATLSQGGGH